MTSDRGWNTASAEGKNLIRKKRLQYSLGAELQRENRRDGEEESQEETREEEGCPSAPSLSAL